MNLGKLNATVDLHPVPGRPGVLVGSVTGANFIAGHRTNFDSGWPYVPVQEGDWLVSQPLTADVATQYRGTVRSFLLAARSENPELGIAPIDGLWKFAWKDMSNLDLLIEGLDDPMIRSFHLNLLVDGGQFAVGHDLRLGLGGQPFPDLCTTRFAFGSPWSFRRLAQQFGFTWGSTVEGGLSLVGKVFTSAQDGEMPYEGIQVAVGDDADLLQPGPQSTQRQQCWRDLQENGEGWTLPDDAIVASAYPGRHLTFRLQPGHGVYVDLSHTTKNDPRPDGQYTGTLLCAFHVFAGQQPLYMSQSFAWLAEHPRGSAGANGRAVALKV